MLVLEDSKRRKLYPELMRQRTRLRKVLPNVLAGLLGMLDDTTYKKLLMGSDTVLEFILAVARHYRLRSGQETPAETEMFGFVSDLALRLGDKNPFPQAPMETPHEIMMWLASWVNCVLERRDLEWNGELARGINSIFDCSTRSIRSSIEERT